jgi:hypothetical protein
MAYAAAEAGVHIATRYFSGLTEKPARVIFAGMRLGDLSERLRALSRETKKYTEIDTCLVQLSKIRAERDKIVHRSGEFQPEKGLRFSNETIAKSAQEADERVFDISELRAMEQDCEAIFIRLAHAAEIFEPKHYKTLSVLSALAPWRYTFPQPRKAAKGHRGKRKERQRRPPASQG